MFDSEDQTLPLEAILYITSDNLGNVYARSTSGYVALPITFKEITVGAGALLFTFVYVEFRVWYDTAQRWFQVYNVVLTAEPEPVPSAMLHSSDAPQGSGCLFIDFQPFTVVMNILVIFGCFLINGRRKKGKRQMSNL